MNGRKVIKRSKGRVLDGCHVRSLTTFPWTAISQSTTMKRLLAESRASSHLRSGYPRAGEFHGKIVTSPAVVPRIHQATVAYRWLTSGQLLYRDSWFYHQRAVTNCSFGQFLHDSEVSQGLFHPAVIAVIQKLLPLDIFSYKLTFTVEEITHQRLVSS